MEVSDSYMSDYSLSATPIQVATHLVPNWNQ